MINILVIEDSPTALKVIDRYFSQIPDLTATYCASQAEASFWLSNNDQYFDAALADLCLPDAPDGSVVDVILRAKVPCIVLTGTQDDRLRESLFSKGIVDLIPKSNEKALDYALALIRRIEKNKSKRLLLVEDSQVSQRFICNLLSAHGYRVDGALTGAEAKALLTDDSRYDLIIIDQQLPDMSGLDLLAMLQQHPLQRDIPVLGISAEQSGALVAEFIKNGADDFLKKPFCSEELTCRISKMFERFDMAASLRKAATIDQLTDVFNRRALYSHFQRLRKQSDDAISLAVLDLDDFKRINDLYGHHTGDRVLRSFARILRTVLAGDCVGRLGGEEFAIISRVDGETLTTLLDKVQRLCHGIAVELDLDTRISFSGGIYTGSQMQFEDMYQQADQQLYRSKHNGKGHTSRHAVALTATPAAEAATTTENFSLPVC